MEERIQRVKLFPSFALDVLGNVQIDEKKIVRFSFFDNQCKD